MNITRSTTVSTNVFGQPEILEKAIIITVLGRSVKFIL